MLELSVLVEKVKPFILWLNKDKITKAYSRKHIRC